jgi:hypothetical protein
MTSTFYGLLALSDLSATQSSAQTPPVIVEEQPSANEDKGHKPRQESGVHRPALHYNIQIHLPATKDVEVFNSIFKSLKEHLLD